MLDDLERALAAAEQHEEAQLEEGVRLVHRSLVEALQKEGRRRDRDARRVRSERARGAALAAGRREGIRRRSSTSSRRAIASATGCSVPRG